MVAVNNNSNSSNIINNRSRYQQAPSENDKTTKAPASATTSAKPGAHDKSTKDPASHAPAAVKPRVDAAAQTQARRRASSDVTAQKLARTAAQQSAASHAPLTRGQTGEDVRKLQEHLVDAGYLTEADMATGPGIFGPHTEAAVRALQEDAGLPVTGVADWDTRRGLARVNRTELRRGDEGRTVLALQNELVHAGLMTPAQQATGPGIFGPQTDAAVREAQRRAGLPVTGVADAATRRAIRASYATPTTTPTTPTTPTPTTPTPTTPPSSAGGAVTDVDTANQSFITQYTDPTWNPTGPAFSANCGPASVAMALSAAGKMPAGLTPEQRVDYARALMNPGNGDVYNIDVGGRSVPQLDHDHDYSDQSQVQAAFQSQGGGGTWGEGWAALDGALQSGPVVVDGYYSQSGWGAVETNAAARQGINGRAGSGEVGHLLSVLGMTDDGRYLVCDPMFTGGCVPMTRDELAVFCGDPSFVSFR